MPEKARIKKYSLLAQHTSPGSRKTARLISQEGQAEVSAGQIWFEDEEEDEYLLQIKVFREGRWMHIVLDENMNLVGVARPYRREKDAWEGDTKPTLEAKGYELLAPFGD